MLDLGTIVAKNGMLTVDDIREAKKAVARELRSVRKWKRVPEVISVDLVAPVNYINDAVFSECLIGDGCSVTYKFNKPTTVERAPLNGYLLVWDKHAREAKDFWRFGMQR